MISLDPVAYVQTSSYEKADLPRQGSLSFGADHTALIRFLPGLNFEQALEDLQGMEKIWVLFWMHQVEHWKAKVQPPRAVQKKGVFATRSPHRPNPIGLSCVTLLEVRGLDLLIKDHDLLDKTPVLDVKPYLPYADSFPDIKTGWLEDVDALPVHEIIWHELSSKQLVYLKERGVDLKDKVEARLKYFIRPSASNRIKPLGEDFYLESYKEWRILFEKKESQLKVIAIVSGYEEPDLPLLHKDFLTKFESEFSETIARKVLTLYSAFMCLKKRSV